MTDEIKSLRQKDKEFASTNSHDTYVILIFSTKKDKDEFVTNAGIEVTNGDTIMDGYEVARKLKINPAKPKFKLKEPF